MQQQRPFAARLWRAAFLVLACFGQAASLRAQAPTITTTTSPARQVVNLGGNLTLSVTATGSAALQWKRNGRQISGATSASLTISGANPARDNGWYQATATNASGSTTSSVIFVNVAVNSAQIVTVGTGSAIPTGLGGLISISSGSAHHIAHRADGTVVAWGVDNGGSITPPTGLTNVVAVSAGFFHGLALKSNGTVVGWGSAGTADDGSKVPAGLSGVVAIAAGYGSNLALKADGTVVGWGSNISGQATVPAGLSGVVAVAAGFGHSLALKSDGTVVGWGFDLLGQASPPAGLTNVVAISAGYWHSLALKSDGTVVAWGYDPSVTGVPAALSGVVGIAANRSYRSYNVALKSDGTVSEWGGASVTWWSSPSGLSKIVGLAPADNYALLLRDSGSDTQLPAIATQPESQTAYLTGNLNLSVSMASNSAPPIFQWRKDGVALSGATNATYSVFGLQASQAGVYDVVVSNTVGSVASAGATVTLASPPLPTITRQPESGSINVGDVGSFSVAASSQGALSYRWRKNGVPITTGAFASPTYIVGQVQASDAGGYDVVVTNATGSVTSAVAQLEVNPLSSPVFTTQPTSGVLNLGNVASFTVVTSAAVPLTFQWRKDGVPIPGATGPTYSFLTSRLNQAGVYDVVATNRLGTATSQGATLLFNDTIVTAAITQQPIAQTVPIGTSATLSVLAIGSPAPTYQWRKNGVPVANATTATLQIPLVQDSDAGNYDVVVANIRATVVSAPARLNVRGRPVLWTARLGFDGEAIGAFTVEGSGPKRLLVRALGPALLDYGITSALVDPRIEIYDSTGSVIASNDDWNTHPDQAGLIAASAAAGAAPLGDGSGDAVLLRSFAPGTYVARVTASSGGGRVVQLELYDAEPASVTRVPYAAVRGRASAGSDVVVGGLGVRGTSQRIFLLRAAGPALGDIGAMANPRFTLLRSDTNSVRASNDDWQSGADTADVAAAAARLGTFAFANGSHDSAMLLAGSVRESVTNTAVVSGVGGGAGLVLVEAIEADAERPTLYAPAVVSPPITQTVVPGTNVTLEARAIGTEPLTYQWRKDGADIAVGGNTRTLALTNVPSSVAGTYTVMVSNAYGTALSAPAVLTVDNGTAAPVAAQTVATRGYAAGGTVRIVNTLTYSATATAVSWSVTIPEGWTYAGGGGEGAVRPTAGDEGTLDWAWINPPSGGSLTFAYILNIPRSADGTVSIPATASVRDGGDILTVTASPSPILLSPGPALHSADTDQDGTISLLELTRVIELYNTRSGLVRTGAYKADTTNAEDGFAGDPGRETATTTARSVFRMARYHSADTRGSSSGSAPDGTIDLFELTRVIQLYNTRTDSVRTGRYHVQQGTEDGFAPGP